ncbi:MAG TPA: response regulator transcription factor [Myxococcales bacterium]|jgi:DNA-binding response OmpR family regulator
MAFRVLLIDDDPRLAELLGGYLAQNEVSLSHAPDGPRGLAMLDADPFDAVLLDVMMPGMNGLDVCRRIRAKGNTPILMLTARGDEADRVVGLELGADDYIPKPFSPRELLARLRAVLRRSRPEAVADRLQVGPIAIDANLREAKVSGRVLDLTGLEFDLLLALVRRAGRVIPREALLSEAGRSDTVVSGRTVDVHVSHLRAKLGDDPKDPKLIRTVRGVGYVLSKGEP